MSERNIQSISEGSEINRTLAAVKAAKKMRARLRQNISLNRHVSLLIAYKRLDLKKICYKIPKLFKILMYWIDKF